MAEQATAGRREQILEAALRVIGRSGTQSVTHRAVAEEAGVPLGSTTYYFDSKDDLLRQALEHVAASEVERYRDLAEELRTVESADELADRLIDKLVTTVEDRTSYIAEYELWLEAGRRPELREAAQSWCDAEQRSVAGAMEALMAALYEEGGMALARTAFLALWAQPIADLDTPKVADPKTALQEWAQGAGRPLPHYAVVARKGPDHAPTFTVEATVKGYAPIRAEGRSRQDAEKAAALKLLERERAMT